MMVSRSNHKALLAELLVVVLFFTLSQLIVLHMFIKAEEINRNTKIRNQALIQAEITAETLAVSDDVEQALLALGFTLEDGTYTMMSLDGYHLQAGIDHIQQTAGNLTTVELKAFREETELFSLPIVHYQGVKTP